MTLRARFQVRRNGFDLDLELELPGQGITALFGPSGCGKTTLLRAIAGLDRHTGGQLSVGDTVWQSEERFVPPHRRSVGYVFQEASLFPHLNVKRNLEYGYRRARGDRWGPELERICQLLDLFPLLARPAGALSGGERQRVAIARALSAGPHLLLMDEPLASLDEQRKQEILPYILAVQREWDIPLVYVSHSRDEVSRLADYLVLLENGRLRACGEIHDVFTRLDLDLSLEPDACAIIDARVSAHDDHFQLTELDFPGGRISIVRQPLEIGSPVRLRLAARDVSLTLKPQGGTSILNIFPARVDAMAESGSAQVALRLLAGGVPLLAHLTRKSVVSLGLENGRMVYAQAKSVALLT